MRRTLSALIVAAFVVVAIAQAQTTEPGAPPLRSATEFLSDALKQEQANLAANRGSLWVDQGATLWASTPAAAAGSGISKSCASCHGPLTTMKGVAARYPAVDDGTGDVFTLEMRINACRSRHQNSAPFAVESDDLLALTAAIAVQSRGMPINISIDGKARAKFETGRDWFYTRQGQLNLSCAQCHVDNVGRKLRGDTISSGVGTGYPVYRLEWNGMGSLHRRLRACQIGVRASELPFGSPEHVAIELYLAWRERGMAVETPALRR